ncbi:MAG: DUF1292 domain-containing protein [Lachnospiraceae bacterium]|jgi:hypothetical protein|nr:DUF1292 domain-containing protein [Lachnospiraceae bacterium]
MEKIVFQLENDEAVAFYVLEQTMIGGNNYILVTESEEGEDGEALILKELNAEPQKEVDVKKDADAKKKADANKEAKTVAYEIVSDATELDAVAAVFGNLLDDTTLLGENGNY